MNKKFGSYLAIIISTLVILGTAFPNYSVSASTTTKKAATKKVQVVAKKKSTPAKKPAAVVKKAVPAVKKTSTATTAASAAKWKVTVSNNGKNIVLTDAIAKKLGIVKIDAALKKKDGSKVKQNWTGVTLKSVLKYCKITGYTSIVAEAADGYKVEYTPEIAQADGTILGYAADGKAVDKASGPVMLVVKGQMGNMWVKNLTKITASYQTTVTEKETAKWTVSLDNNGTEIAFTDLDAKKIAAVQIDTVLKKKDGTEQKQAWTGVTLKSVLKYYNITNYTTIAAIAADGYTKQYTKDIAEADGTILGFTADGKELDSEAGPVELVVNGQSGNMWIKKLTKLTVTSEPAPIVKEIAKWTVTIDNNGTEIAFTDLDAKKIPTVQLDTVLKKKDGTEQKQAWTGVTLKSVLKYYNISGYTTISAIAIDGYTKDYTSDIAEADGTILGFTADGKELDSEAGPVELVANGQSGSMWIKKLTKITVKK
jgi:DMSO/TMAO reductase YedYZ molybdopterin-dependent catalytic subunit